MSDVTITGLSIVARPKPNTGGSRILAYFDCRVGGLELRGCALVKTSKNGLVAWPPKLEGPEAVRRSVAIVDNVLRHVLMSSARDVYRMMGGTEAEWVKRDHAQSSDMALDWSSHRVRAGRQGPVSDASASAPP